MNEDKHGFIIDFSWMLFKLKMGKSVQNQQIIYMFALLLFFFELLIIRFILSQIQYSPLTILTSEKLLNPSLPASCMYVEE